MDSSEMVVESPVGRRGVDRGGAPLGVGRVEVNRAYPQASELLRESITRGSEQAWGALKGKIDYIYRQLDTPLGALEEATQFSGETRARVARGARLFFKPNILSPFGIDPAGYGAGVGATINTEWAFVAALMRWFHDRLRIRYGQMALGEASPTMAIFARYSSRASGQTITPEALIEGRSGEFYGGWGAYFIRRYLRESCQNPEGDDPMAGHAESVSGAFLPPGRGAGKLLVYDLNRVLEDGSNVRAVPVPEGANFQTLTLPKVIVGGAPGDPDDLAAYPGCVLVNVPKLKVHNSTLFTCALKNIGMGLFSVHVRREDGKGWAYSFPHTPMPGVKGGVPHEIWTPEIDADAGVPVRDARGEYVLHRTGGLEASVVDMNAALKGQDVFILHVVDAIECINLDHAGRIPGVKVPEGLIVAGRDAVATDLLCVRYMMSNVGMREAGEAAERAGQTDRFPQAVPVPALQDGQIVTRPGYYDFPLSRDWTFELAVRRGIGQGAYHVKGSDAISGRPLASVEGRLGTLEGGRFTELTTQTLYFNAYKMPWDLQRTAFGYLEAADAVAGTDVKGEFLRAFDANGDGAVTFYELGRKGAITAMVRLTGASMSLIGREQWGFLRGPFRRNSFLLRLSCPEWNRAGLDTTREYLYGYACYKAYVMSEWGREVQDPFAPSLRVGKGKWPSFAFAYYMHVGDFIYGSGFPERIDLAGLYGSAFRYADVTQNGGRYAGTALKPTDPDAVSAYIAGVRQGRVKPLRFTLYVPKGYGQLAGLPVPNVEEVGEPACLLSASFREGEEVWP